MLVKDWLPGLLARVWPEQFGRDWPGKESEEGRVTWHHWMLGLREAKAQRSEAEAAADRLRERGPFGTAGEVLQALRSEILNIRDDAARPAPDPTEDREAVKGRSRGCRYCAGEGLATLYHPRYDGGGVLYVERPDPVCPASTRRVAVPARVAAHCVCDHGRWIRAKTKPEMLPKIPDLAEVLAGRSRWLARDPRDTDPDPGPRGRWPREKTPAAGSLAKVPPPPGREISESPSPTASYDPIEGASNAIGRDRTPQDAVRCATPPDPAIPASSMPFPAFETANLTHRHPTVPAGPEASHHASPAADPPAQTRAGLPVAAAGRSGPSASSGGEPVRPALEAIAALYGRTGA